MLLLLPLLLAGCASKPPAPAPSPLSFNPDKWHVGGDAVDETVQTWMKSQHIPGLALAIVRDGQILKAQGYGLADVLAEIPVRPDTAFPIASLSKPFLATVIMMLVDEGRLQLDDPIGKYLPGIPAAWNSITVRSLVRHTSGIINIYTDEIIVNDFQIFGWRMFNHYLETQGDLGSQEVFDALAEQTLRFPPNSEYRYSNSNYHLLAMIIRQVTGKPYEVMLRERIFVPLAMTRTQVFGDGPPLADIAAGYRWENNQLVRGGRLPTIDGKGIGGGGIVSTVSDIAKWETALMSGKLVSPAALNRMLTAERLPNGKELPYGLGWQILSVNGSKAVAHSGLWHRPGYTSVWIRFLDEKLSMIILNNQASVDFSSVPLELLKEQVPGAPKSPLAAWMHTPSR